jgi:hypothetical protein
MRYILLLLLVATTLTTSAQSAKGYLGEYRFPLTKDYVVTQLAKDLSLSKELHTQLGLVFTTYFNRISVILSSPSSKSKDEAIANTNTMLDNSAKDLLGDALHTKYLNLKATIVPLAVDYDKHVQAGKLD